MNSQVEKVHMTRNWPTSRNCRSEGGPWLIAGRKCNGSCQQPGGAGSGSFLGHVLDEAAVLADAWIVTWQGPEAEDPAVPELLRHRKREMIDDCYFNSLILWVLCYTT